MSVDQYAQLYDQFKDIMTLNEPMADHTTWRIGGPADVFARPQTIDQLQELVIAAQRQKIPFYLVGKGSNLLISDEGIRGIVIQLDGQFEHMTFHDDQLLVYGAKGMVATAYNAMAHGLSGLEFATGIPGSIGGAVAMNAGAHGREIRDVLTYADLLTRNGERIRLSKEELGFSYRHSLIKEHGWIVLSASFRLEPGDAQAMQETAKSWARRRSATQPLSLPSCGSVFRNPQGDFAARLIEAAGLKGKRIGMAQISEKHANFIVNLGDAKASEVAALIQLVRETIAEREGILLYPEVKMMGDFEYGGGADGQIDRARGTSS